MLTQGITLPTSCGLVAGIFNTPVVVDDVVLVESSDGLVSAARVLRSLIAAEHEHVEHAAEIEIMLKPCKVVTRSTATGLFFGALPSLVSRRLTDAWYNARGDHARSLERFGKPDLRFAAATDAALFVRIVGVDRIVEALVHSTRQRARLRRVDFFDPTLGAGPVTNWCDDRMRPGHTVIVGDVLSDENEALYGVPPEVVSLASNAHVLADKLLSLGHWVAESYALWVSRPRGASRAKWQRAAALKFVEALPVPADMYAMRHEPGIVRVGAGEHNVVTVARTPNASSVHLVVERKLSHGTRDAFVLARTVEDAMQELYGASYRFTLHALSDERWAVSVAGLDPFVIVAPVETLQRWNSIARRSPYRTG